MFFPSSIDLQIHVQIQSLWLIDCLFYTSISRGIQNDHLIDVN